ncbi:hypothetical protein BXO88_06270 [Oribacterium sp. C9]|uniref:hypothetical protein n=1 Tax=Oribacterium sp. C9 TaxID=1943579 RepID=UPI00098ECEC8|nr:hypothetical protein [Oribacterium sp. C9]OON86863.1 hypothetical protein BXO88_06270 [Oribacterium sp. C9]
MKKRIAMLVAVIMAILSFGMVSFAKGNVTELKWSDGEKTAKQEGIKGKFVELDEVAIKFWLPNDYKASKLTKDDKENGYIAYYEDGKTDGVVAVVLLDAGIKSLSDYKKELKKMDDVSEIEDCIINDIDCIGYRVKDENTMNISYSTESGKILEFTFAPVTDDDDDSITVPAIIMSSIQETD